MQVRLLLEDGSLFTGESFGATGESLGEVVFNTSMTGYQEVLSDPSYCGQMVVMTYPLIGNYGITREDYESVKPYIRGMIVREYETLPSNWRSMHSLDECLKEANIMGISGLDTRMLTRKIRHHGSMKGILSTGNESLEELKQKLNAFSFSKESVMQTSTQTSFHCPGTGKRIVLLDCGAKTGIVREYTQRGCDVIVVPHDTSAQEILSYHPDGVQLSNGPGDPKDLPHVTEMLKELIGRVPIFGICLGHQLLALACGADTEKLKFGHRGANHPVKELATGHCTMTSQNHGYSVVAESLSKTDLEVTHINNNDKTVEGLRHKIYPVFSVQYHPEASPGPWDSSYLFDQFLAEIERVQSQNKKGVK